MSLGGGRSNMLDLLELAGHLRNEKLFIAQEKKTLHGLFATLDERSREVHGLNWILQQQRCLAADLILGSPDVAPYVCFAKFNSLDEANFTDGYKLLTHHEIRVGKFLKSFRERPDLVALCLQRAEQSGSPRNLQRTVRTVMLQLYGGLLLPEDEDLATSVLQHLLRLQVNAGKVRNPVRFASKRNSAFVHAYRILTECLPSTKSFLTVAFHDPTIALLAEDEWLYDIDPERALTRFDSAEISRKFGTPGTETFARKVETYRARIVAKLVSLTKRFVYGLEFGMTVFPGSLAAVLKEAYELFRQSSGGKEEAEAGRPDEPADGGFGRPEPPGEDGGIEAAKACLYLLLNVFVCPAVCDPEIRGVVFDVPLGEVARHNLLQVAQLIQVLALLPYDSSAGTGPKYGDLCNKFDEDCLSFLLGSIVHGNNSNKSPAVGNGDVDVAMVRHDNKEFPDCVGGPQRSSILMSPQDFVDLMELVHATASHQSTSCDAVAMKSHADLKELVAGSNLPSMAAIRGCCQKYLDQLREEDPLPSSPVISSATKKLVSSYSPSFGSRKQMSTDESLLTRSTGTAREGRQHQGVYKTVSSYNCSSSAGEVGPAEAQKPPNDVIVINLGVYSECPGMLSEQKVFEQELISRKQKLQANSILPGEEEEEEGEEGGGTKQGSGNLLVSGKRTRFSLSHDTDSIEPNNEGISEEAVSSHSTDDDDNDDDDDGNSTNNSNDDNLSDMAYSANLSGRNTPSIVSGRDTPVSLMSGAAGTNNNHNNHHHHNDDDDDGNNDGNGHNDGGNNGDGIVIAEVVINGTALPQSSGCSAVFRGVEASSVARCGIGGCGGGGVVSVVVGHGRDQGSRKREQQRRDDVTDRFGKFDIKQDIELEAKSTVSDTWSTDVLASDSEPPPEQNHLVRLEEVVEENVILPSRGGASGGGGGMGAALSETGISETASDAWSTDVLASDTSERQAERLLELDQDETCAVSVAGLNVPNSDSGFEKAHLSGIKQSHHQQQQQQQQLQHHHHHQGGDPRLFPCHLRPSSSSSNHHHHHHHHHHQQNPSDPNNPEVFDSLSDTSSNKGTLGSFDVFDSQEGDSLFSAKRDFETTSNGTAFGDPLTTCSSSGGGGSNEQQGTSDRFMCDLPDDPAATAASTGPGKMGGVNYGRGFEMFDPFAPLPGCGRSQVRDLAKTTNSSSADNLDVLVTPSCNDLFATSRTSSSSMTRIFDEAMMRSEGSRSDEPQDFPLRARENPVQCRSDLKKKSGLFGTFKERLSKVNQANKRKISRRTEDMCREAPSVLIDFDDGVDCSNKDQQKCNSWKSESSIINTENILAKYRTAPICEVLTAFGPQQQQQQHRDTSLLDGIQSASYSTSPLFHHHQPHHPPLNPLKMASGAASSSSSSDPWGNVRSVRGTVSFADAKKKLRLVLSSVDCSQFKTNERRTLANGPPCQSKARNSRHLPGNDGNNNVDGRAGEASPDSGKEQLIMFLKVQLADSMVSGDRTLSAQLQETIRCLSCLDSHEVKRLLKSLKEDYKMRSYYIAYLTRCKKSILSSMAFYEGLLSRVNRERSTVNRCLVSVMTRLYLEKRDLQIIRFVSEFQRILLFDEKSDLVDKFLFENLEDMRNDHSWKASNESQLDLAQLCMERTIMSHIYVQALFPNGDGDILRDRKMEDHMRHLSQVITPDSRYLKIPSVYHNECPWLAAQKELTMINAFKTPEDKLECVVRCCSTIMTLLGLALTRSTDVGHRGSGDGEETGASGAPRSEPRASGGVPAADDFMPVLIYVVVASCTPNLLSTVQYVRNYCEKSTSDDGRGEPALHRPHQGRRVLAGGEKLYWWMQFVAAVEFIKTMEYGE